MWKEIVTCSRCKKVEVQLLVSLDQRVFKNCLECRRNKKGHRYRRCIRCSDIHCIHGVFETCQYSQCLIKKKNFCYKCIELNIEKEKITKTFQEAETFIQNHFFYNSEIFPLISP